MLFGCAMTETPIYSSVPFAIFLVHTIEQLIRDPSDEQFLLALLCSLDIPLAVRLDLWPTFAGRVNLDDTQVSRNVVLVEGGWVDCDVGFTVNQSRFPVGRG